VRTDFEHNEEIVRALMRAGGSDIGVDLIDGPGAAVRLRAGLPYGSLI
jgi:hypothetical protein